ncbi:MAG TPA: tol-pal system protein YbgF [Rhodocyclaceae bacterium]|nr:tol-pal system protein YbgF [Rhodocyclaceae bacterium]
MSRIGIVPLLAAAAFASALAAFPAHAGLFDDDEARGQIEKLHGDLAEQAKKMDSGFATSARGQIDLANQIEALKAEIARLRGQVEVQNYDIETAKKRQTDFYTDLDSRLRKLEAGAQAAAAPAAAPPADPAAETRDYEAALTLFKATKYKEALAAFQDFVKNHGASTLAPSAQYWAASTYYQMREYAKAAETFAKVPAAWPKDSKAPDALLGQANSQKEAGEAKAARKTYESLIKLYPDSGAAKTARQRLKKK